MGRFRGQCLEPRGDGVAAALPARGGDPARKADAPEVGRMQHHDPVRKCGKGRGRVFQQRPSHEFHLRFSAAKPAAGAGGDQDDSEARFHGHRG